MGFKKILTSSFNLRKFQLYFYRAKTTKEIERIFQLAMNHIHHEKSEDLDNNLEQFDNEKMNFDKNLKAIDKKMQNLQMDIKHKKE